MVKMVNKHVSVVVGYSLHNKDWLKSVGCALDAASARVAQGPLLPSVS